MADKKLYMQTDDRLNVGSKPLRHTDPKGQELHDKIMKDRKQILSQYKKIEIN